MSKKLVFPEGFLWGTSTSAYQVEGCDASDWGEWEHSPKRLASLEKMKCDLKNHTCGLACNSLQDPASDLLLCADLNNNAARFGLEWARIEPKVGEWNVEAIKYYRHKLEKAKSLGMQTVLTLWHWTNPAWFAASGGWSNSDNVERYLEFVQAMIDELGSLVDYWITLNEPMIHVMNGYMRGNFPPGRRNPFLAWRTYRNLLRAHRGAYLKIHSHFPEAKVSFTQLVNHVEAARPWFPLEWLIAKAMHLFWNHSFLAASRKYLDYIAFDYYFHDRIVWYPPFKKNLNQKVTDMGWEIYPEGIYHVIKYLQSFGKPVFVMENGLADAEDKYRKDFIRDHLTWVHRAISEGADVRGYFHWSLLDNYEWAAGFLPRFGLYAVDYSTFARTPRPSAAYYAEIAKNNALEID